MELKGASTIKNNSGHPRPTASCEFFAPGGHNGPVLFPQSPCSRQPAGLHTGPRVLISPASLLFLSVNTDTVPTGFILSCFASFMILCACVLA